MTAPAKAQVAQFEAYVGTDPSNGADPNYYGSQPYYDQGYQDPAYDPYYGQQYSQDPYGYDNGYGYGDQYSYGDQYGYGNQYGYDYGYDWADPYYYTAPSYTPAYDPFYDPYCDYYTPPWGFPLDYCRYQVWRQPVYFGGLWYSGPIYYRVVNNVNWFWINGSWCRDQWYGPRPSYIDWSRNRRWDGPRHNWRDEYRRGTWAGRNTWVGRSYRDNIREARANVLDRARDREFRRDFAARNLGRTGNVAGPGRGRGGEFDSRLDRPGIVNEGRAPDFAGSTRDRRVFREGGSTLVRPNERGAAPERAPRIENRARTFAPVDPGRRLENRAAPQRNFAVPERGPRFENRSPQRGFAAPERTPRFENRGTQRSFAAPDRGPRFDNRAAQRSFAAPNRAPPTESRAPRFENRGSSGSRNSFAAPGGAPRVARPNGGQRFDAGNRGGGGARAFSGGGGGSPRAFSGGGNRGSGVSRGGGNSAPRAERGRGR
jgi:hypothetical protein